MKLLQQHPPPPGKQCTHGSCRGPGAVARSTDCCCCCQKQPAEHSLPRSVQLRSESGVSPAAGQQVPSDRTAVAGPTAMHTMLHDSYCTVYQACSVLANSPGRKTSHLCSCIPSRQQLPADWVHALCSHPLVALLTVSLSTSHAKRTLLQNCMHPMAARMDWAA